MIHVVVQVECLFKVKEFVRSHGGRRDDISIYGQESNPTTWRLAAMNLAIRGFSADLGKEPGDTHLLKTNILILSLITSLQILLLMILIGGREIRRRSSLGLWQTTSG